MVMRRVSILLLGLLLAGGLLAQKQKKKADEEPRPQVLEVLPDTPEAVVADTERLSFQVSPLSDKGLLSQQVRDALKAVARLNHGVSIIKIRAFVAGSGDLRRIKDIVAEEFTERKQTLPAVSTIQVGGLPLPGAQVVIETISSEKKVVNPDGLVFLSAAASTNAAGSVAKLENSLKNVGAKAADVLRVTCFLSSLDDVQAARSAVATAFPAAAANFLQMQRLGLERQTLCEAIARASGNPLADAPASGVALIHSAKIVLTATQLVFRDQDSDFRLAYQRLEKTLLPLGATFKDVFWTGTYALTQPGAAKLENVQGGFFDRASPLAHTALQIEGLPSTDATAAVELMAVGR
ncbi:MAG: RidA family protein [Acidobacteriota bacterium]|nr:RidA family protein [Acidobacteriota bacterium]